MTKLAEKPTVHRFAIDELEFAEYNPRAISELARQGLHESLEELGLLDVPVVNVSDGKRLIVGGHQRIRDLKDNGYTHVDCLIVELGEVDERAANLTLNNPAAQGKWDVGAALAHVKALHEMIPDAGGGLDRLHRALRLRASRNPSVRDTAKKHEQTEPTVSELGTIYQIGDHRLFCGDILEQGVLTRLLANGKASACITDPPYNVSYTLDGENAIIARDDMSTEEWQAFLGQICGEILEFTTGLVYICMSAKEFPALEAAWKQAGGVLVRWLAWFKNQPSVNSFHPTDFKWQSEWILFGTRKGGKVQTFGDASTNVLPFDRMPNNKLHPSQKPLELIETLVRDATPKKGTVVLDPFAGSGTTLIACEKTGRKFAGGEIDPRLCDIIRRRWVEETDPESVEDWEALTPALKEH